MREFDNIAFRRFLSNSKGHAVVVLDTETTGFSTSRDRVVQFSAKKRYMDDDFTLSETEVPFDNTLDFYIRSDVPMPASAFAVNGISDEFLAENGITQQEAVDRIRDFVGESPVIGQNVIFDIRMLNGLFNQAAGNELYGPLFNPQWVGDTLPLARKVLSGLPGEKPYSLENLVRVTGNADKVAGFHNSLHDVEATILVWNSLIRIHDGRQDARAAYQREPAAV